MLYSKGKRSAKRNYFCKGYLYKKIKDKAEEDFIESYRDGDRTYLEDCINDAIDNYWDEILESEDYEDIKDEDELSELLLKEIEDDLDEDELIDDLETDNSYRGLSARQRNYGLRR